VNILHLNNEARIGHNSGVSNEINRVDNPAVNCDVGSDIETVH
jgi:hypothetical protein